MLAAAEGIAEKCGNLVVSTMQEAALAKREARGALWALPISEPQAIE